MHLDNSACNLASINLLHYLDESGDFDVDSYTHTIDVIFTAQEILVGRADYPTEPIADNSRKFRQLGIGYANLGATLMALGLPYDSPEGRSWAAALTSLMTGHAYATSARTASPDGSLRRLCRQRDAHAQRAADAPRCPSDHREPPRGAGRTACGRRGRLGDRRTRRRRVRSAQQPGQCAGAHRHHRVDDGLRHDRHRARPRVGEDEETGRRRHDDDRQPDHPASTAQAGLHARADRRHHRLHRYREEHPRRPSPRCRSCRGVRLQHGRQHHPLRGTCAHDGCGAAVHLRRHLQDGQHARGCFGGRHRGPPPVVVGARSEGRGHLPRQLQGCPAPQHRPEGRQGRDPGRRCAAGHPGGREDRREGRTPADPPEAAAQSTGSYVRVPGGRLQGLRQRSASTTTAVPARSSSPCPSRARPSAG